MRTFYGHASACSCEECKLIARFFADNPDQLFEELQALVNKGMLRVEFDRKKKDFVFWVPK